MSKKQKQLISRVVSLCLDVNEETDCKASFTVFPEFIVIKVEDSKSFVANEIYSGTSTIAGIHYDEKELESKLEAFFAFAHNLIKK